MTRDDEAKADEPHPNTEPSDAQETQPCVNPPQRTSHLASRILENAAREQLAGPFGKLGRYALKQQGLTIWDREKEIKETSVHKEAPKKAGLFSRLITLLKRPFQR